MTVDRCHPNPQIELDFVTLDVFTTTKFLGNPLAIVHIPAGLSLSQEQKHTITKEFNLSETVFLHKSLAETNSAIGEVKIDIWTIDQELPFAGHPVVGTAFYILSNNANRESKPDEDTSCTLQIKAGPTLASFSPRANRARLGIPHAFTVHSDVHVSTETIASALGVADLPSESIIPNDVAGKGVALVSPVHGLAFFLVQVSSLDVLAAMRNTGVKWTAKMVGLGKEEEDTFIATYVYHVQSEESGTMKLRTRMFEGLWEDPATGSAASCLGGYLSMRASTKEKDQGVYRTFEITQAVEMPRRSDIVVEVQSKVNDGGEYGVEKLWLSGSAVTVMKGKISI